MEMSSVGIEEDTGVYTNPSCSGDTQSQWLPERMTWNRAQALPGYTSPTKSNFNTVSPGTEILQFHLSSTQTRIPIQATHQKFSLFRQ